MEVGGLMTHGSVMAHEYGIPAVIGVDGSSRELKFWTVRPLCGAFLFLPLAGKPLWVRERFFFVSMKFCAM